MNGLVEQVLQLDGFLHFLPQGALENNELLGEEHLVDVPKLEDEQHEIFRVHQNLVGNEVKVDADVVDVPEQLFVKIKRFSEIDS